jgi:hypothetical protein
VIHADPGYSARIIGDIRYEDELQLRTGYLRFWHISFHALPGTRLRLSARLARENRRW